MFNFLIEKALDARLRQISHISDNSLRKACRKSMEKLAFVMECRGENVISKVELEQLIGDKTEKEVLLKKSSLIEFQDNSWRFAHNNFQEYLAAYALSKSSDINNIRRAIAFKPDYQRLKWSWTNALSFLFDLWEDGNPMKNKLLDWLAKSDLEALIKIGSFEKDRISLADREQVFRLEFENCKKEDRFVGSHHYNYWDMAEFGESANTVRYLTQELKSAKTHIVRGNALELLKSMNAYSVPSDVKAVLRAELFRNIYDFEVNSPSDRHYAMEALFQLFGDLTNEEAVKMAETFFNSDDAQERAASYLLIEKQKLQFYFMEQLIVRIQQLEDYNWQKGRALRSDEDVHIEDCFKDLAGEEVLVTFFEKYPVIVENKWDSRQKPLNLMLEKLANSPLSQQGAKRIFEAMKKRFSDWIGYPTESNRDSILDFLEKNGLRFELFKICFDENERWGLALLIDENGVDYLVEKFKRNLIKREWIQNFQHWLRNHRGDMLSLFNQRVNEVTDEPVPLPNPPKDHNQHQIERWVAEKALFFNKEKFVAAIKDIFATFGKDRFSKNEIFNTRWEVGKEDEDIYEKYPTSLIYFIDNNPSMTKDELIEIVAKNWEWISTNQIQNFLKNNQKEIESNPELGLNEHELAIVKNWCENHLSGIDWENRLTDADAVFAWFTVRYHFSDYPESIYLQMVGSGLQNRIGTELDIIEFIQEQKTAPLEKLKARVLDNLRRGKAQGSEVASHLKFIEKQHQTSFILEALPALHGYIEGRTDNSNLRGYYQVQALKTFIALEGDVEYLKKLLEGISGEDDRENTLLEFFLKRKDKQFENILLQKLATSTKNEHQLDYANRLVMLGNLSGLQFLLSYIEREKKSPFFTHGRNPDYQFENPAGIPLLLRFFDYGDDSSIPQDSFNRITNVGRNMLLHLATCQNRKYFPVVRKAIRRHLKWHTWLNNLPKWLKRRIWVAQPSGLTELRYFLKTLEFRYYQKQEVPMAEAVKTWKELNLQNK